MKVARYIAIMLLYALLLNACGDTHHPASVGSTMKAVIKTTALTANKNIAGIILTITVPAGVSPPLQADGTADAAATVEIISSAPAGQNLPGATYTAAAGVPGQLVISAIVPSGFTATDQITIHLKVAEGTVPLESDFKLLSFSASDIFGADVPGLTPVLTTTIN